MSEMVERLTEAIGREVAKFDPTAKIEHRPGGVVYAQVQWEYVDLGVIARAAIEAMREPTAEMIQGAIDQHERELRVRESDVATYTAMIDAALK
jgi:regulator of sirC expression with transglutaminase-like and TPR domain